MPPTARRPITLYPPSSVSATCVQAAQYPRSAGERSLEASGPRRSNQLDGQAHRARTLAQLPPLRDVEDAVLDLRRIERVPVGEAHLAHDAVGHHVQLH